MNVFETPGCSATVSAPGWSAAQCALPRDHPPPHGGFRWSEVVTYAKGWKINLGGVDDPDGQ